MEYFLHLNSDTKIAIVLLLICGGIFINTLQMPPAMFNQMPATLWPQLIIVPLAFLSLLLLIKAQSAEIDETAEVRNLKEWFQYYKNPIVCFVLFFAFLITMPVLGMLIGGLLYVFLTLSFLGGWAPKLMAKHALLSIFFVVGRDHIRRLTNGQIRQSGTRIGDWRLVVF